MTFSGFPLSHFLFLTLLLTYHSHSHGVIILKFTTNVAQSDSPNSIVTVTGEAETKPIRFSSNTFIKNKEIHMFISRCKTITTQMSGSTRGPDRGDGADGHGIRGEKEVLENMKEILRHSDGRDTCLPLSGFPLKSFIDRWIPQTVQSYSGTQIVKLF